MSAWDRVSKLEDKVAELEARIKELEAKNHRPTPVDEIHIKPRPSPYDPGAVADAGTRRRRGRW